MAVFKIDTVPATFGPGASEQLGKIMKGYGCTRVMLVHDPIMGELGHADKLVKIMEAEGLAVGTFSDINSEPTDIMLEAAVKASREFNADGIVGFGGGSALDVSKCISIWTKNDVPLTAFTGGNNGVRFPSLPLVLMATTAGTSSDFSNGFMFSETATGLKKAGMQFANMALVDPTYTLSLPPKVTAATTIDMLAHVTEAYFNPGVNWYTDLTALEAIRIIFKNLPIVLKDGKNEDSRAALSFACCLAGASVSLGKFTHVGHGTADAISALRHLTHGIGCAAGLPVAIYYCVERWPEKVYAVAKAVGIETEGLDAETIGQKVITAYQELIEMGLTQPTFSAEEVEKIIELLLTSDRVKYSDRVNPPGLYEPEAIKRAIRAGLKIAE